MCVIVQQHGQNVNAPVEKKWGRARKKMKKCQNYFGAEGKIPKNTLWSTFGVFGAREQGGGKRFFVKLSDDI
ncbi:hypothetical protein LJC26_06640 [Desulfovibrio sp. OttesenSCG-928-O18]|nr:hypothetical protein [Desulfovibrio sp. OttesenSCG-928-O18]